MMVLSTRRALVLAGAVMVRAQESNRTFRLGMLVGAPRHAPQLAAFFDELGKAGFIEGNNLRIDFRVQGSLDQSLVGGGADAAGSRCPRDWRADDRGGTGGDPDGPDTRCLRRHGRDRTDPLSRPSWETLPASAFWRANSTAKGRKS